MRIAAAGFALLAACGDDTVTAVLDAGSDSPIDAADASPEDASQPDSGPCNMLAVTSSPTTDHLVADAAPSPDGGSVAPGLYFLTDVSVYLTADAAPPPLPTRQEVHAFDDAGLWQYANASGVRLSLAFSPEGTTLHRVAFCPSGVRARDGQFTAGPSSLWLFDYNGGVTTVFTLTRQ